LWGLARRLVQIDAVLRRRWIRELNWISNWTDDVKGRIARIAGPDVDRPVAGRLATHDWRTQNDESPDNKVK
jgi:hypothetical protein